MRRPLRMGMVGGGTDSLMGAIHRTAARMTGRIDLVCGAFSSNRQKSTESGEAIGLPPHGQGADVAQREAAQGAEFRPPGVHSGLPGLKRGVAVDLVPASPRFVGPEKVGQVGGKEVEMGDVELLAHFRILPTEGQATAQPVPSSSCCWYPRPPAGHPR